MAELFFFSRKRKSKHGCFRTKICKTQFKKTEKFSGHRLSQKKETEKHEGNFKKKQKNLKKNFFGREIEFGKFPKRNLLKPGPKLFFKKIKVAVLDFSIKLKKNFDV